MTHALTAGSARRRWTLYAAAWLPMMMAYFGAIMAGGGSVLETFLLMLHNVAPAALAGIGVVHVCERLPWGSRRRDRLMGIHTLFAFVYALAWWGGMVVTRSIAESLWAGHPRLFVLTFDEARWQIGAGALLYVTIVAVRYAGQVDDRLREQEARAARAEALRARAEMQALRAQINPHFLFNTLHSLLELVSAGDGRAEEAIERFGALLHRTIDVRRSAADDVPLSEEIQLVRDYLWIEQLRLGARLVAEIELDEDALSAKVPSFVLQPLVENAVKHAASTRVAPTSIRVSAARERDLLLLWVEDDGPGAILEQVERAPGAGLRLVRGRLEARYGDNEWMRITTAPGAGFRVAIALPVAAPVSATVGQQ
ncbi:sensor histidine kinase [Longimicrobium terrae]|uniref:Signal transduction histidine kinase n=1 Tax=Longimicrobium terrae TaxID=1639882 RepID=A0A841H3Y1_9BACT|nr:histidine kinase [Longimicrobium terrae]MBB4638137.1 signal transduction histidine kinase [Longimicrobium terrae]MBB6072509.1 signal transduction histidine kinase [Longimicrobium terrae]NNC32081.1 histidine kinase [Longimicrobium terrae]